MLGVAGLGHGGFGMTDYKVQFEVFEGPLDLLLYLVKKAEVDIYEVNLTQLATQFIAYVELMRELDLDVAGEFLVMAATLMYIKSRELLPVEQQAPVEEEPEEADPRWELIRQLVEYKKFKDAAARLQGLELRQDAIYPRAPARPELPAESPPPPRVSLFDLLNALRTVLKRFEQRDDLRDIFEDRWTVSEKIEVLLTLLAQRAVVLFSELFAAATSRTEVVVTFLALLELIRLKQVIALQPAEFSQIELRRVTTEAGHEVTAPATETGSFTAAESEVGAAVATVTASTSVWPGAVYS
jgi:segregation and condensation protein A